MAKIAGMESTAKSKSEDSTMIRTNNNLVPYNFSFPLCSIRWKKLSPAKLVFSGIILATKRTAKDLL